MKNLLIVILCVVLSSILATVIANFFGLDLPWLGGGVGGAVAGLVCVKLYGNKQR